ncbi:hypothetical protein ACX0G9_13600 [Flavitalea flava]
MSISQTIPLPSRATTISPKGKVITTASIPLYIYAASLASILTVIGILWDISWHRSIGRDKFLSPPHILIYLGAIFAGLFSGVQVLWNSYRPTEEIKASSVKVWGIFYSSLGAMFCIWGAIAMLTSAPFDDWWHSAYGLDIVILSPPHALLGLGMLFLQFGACVSVSKYLNSNSYAMNTSADRPMQPVLLKGLFIISAASLITMIYTLGIAFLHTRNMRHALFYQIVSFITLLFLPAFGRVLRMKWGMTAIATGYFLICALTNWTLQLFPAEPKLGPVLTHITHFQPAPFPLLIVLPLLTMDWVMQRAKANDWLNAIVLSLLFVLIILLIQYPLSGFLLESPDARNWIFGAASRTYSESPDSVFRYKFRAGDIEALPALAKGIGLAIGTGILVARLSLRWGKWMQQIQR